jgi:hypothetical protein
MLIDVFVVIVRTLLLAVAMLAVHAHATSLVAPSPHLLGNLRKLRSAS